MNIEQTQLRKEENITKLLFIANEFPTKKINEVVGLMEMSPLERTTTVWAAIDAGHLTVEDKTGEITIHKLPVAWEFGAEADYLKSLLIDCFGRLASQEQDIHEEILLQWLNGFKSHDIICATKHLQSLDILATYDLVNETVIKKSKKQKGAGEKDEIVSDTYTFWTLSENKDKRWGMKQFADQSRLSDKV